MTRPAPVVRIGGVAPHLLPRLHPRHRIDATWPDVVYALAASALPAARSGPGDALICLSVRSAFDLLLTALALPAGDEVLVSAVTHPDMVRIVERHGLRAVPADVDPATMAPHPLALRRVVTDRTRVRLVAHLFGARVDLDGAVEVARRHGLLLVEDCAQSIEGAGDTGDERADVSLFSFGFIKTATALGGARVWVRNPALTSALRAAHERWPRQGRGEYAGKAFKSLVALAASHPVVYGLITRSGREPADLVRTVPGRGDDDGAFVAWLRRRPSAPLERVLARRLRRFPADRLRARTEAGEALAATLPPALFRPAARTPRTTHWLLPVVADDPDRLIAGLRHAGFDASQGASQIVAVAGCTGEAPPCAAWIMAGIVFLPAYPELPAAERDRLAEVIRALV